MSKGRDFVARLRENCLVGDGANGTRLGEIGADRSRGWEILNLTQPDLVRRVHAEYADAGAHLVETNTFAANAMRLARVGLEDKAREINLAGARLALEGAGPQVCVAGSIGPLLLSLDEEWDLDRCRQVYHEQITALLDGGVHVLILETFSSLAELKFALRIARDLGGIEIPVIAQMLFRDGGRVESGEDAATVVHELVTAGAAVVGANCGRGVAATTQAALKLLASAGPTPVSAYPNAGFPEVEGGRLVYMATPSYMAENAVRLAKAGVCLLGGCCGTTPDAIRAIALALASRRRKKVAVRTDTAAAATPPAGDSSHARTAEAALFKDGGFLRSLRHPLPIIAEIDPPPHLQCQPMLATAQAVAAAGADAISLAENPLAALKMSNLAVASLLRRELQLQAICHLTCRDRNLLGLQSALMGAHLHDLQGVLAVTGDPLQDGDAGHGVFDLNSFTLVRLMAGLNRGIAAGGQNLKGETDFSVGVAFNSAARNLDGEGQRLQRKAGEGARFVMTQPVFDPDHARRVLEITRRSGLRVFLGFFPLISTRTALYLHNEVPGIRIPETILQRLGAFTAKEDQERAGLDLTLTLLDALLPELDGVYLISPPTRPRALVSLIEHLRATPRGAQTVPPA
jgi:methionine synthase / methylenetetrahydrofolate reductase(NADPH)